MNRMRHFLSKHFAITVPIFLLVATVALLIQLNRHAELKKESRNRFRQIGVALHAYHDAHGTFPPAIVYGPDGERWHSWRAHLLPYLDEQLAAQYRFDEPWNGPHNSQLHDHVPEVFQVTGRWRSSGVTSAMAVVGKRTGWPGPQALAIKDVTDGTSNTLYVVENRNSDVAWLEPRDLSVSEFLELMKQPPSMFQDGGQLVLFIDGSVRFLSAKIEFPLLASLLTPKYRRDTFTGAEWPDDLAESAAIDFAGGTPTDVGQLPATSIVASSREPMDADINTIWCAAFELAWRELMLQVGGDVELSEPTEVVVLLNQFPFSESALSGKAYLAQVTGIHAEETEQLQEGLEQRFGSRDPQLEPFFDTSKPGIRLYAQLRKAMPFEAEFEVLEQPIRFQTKSGLQDVEGFGNEAEIDAEPIYSGQARVLSYGDDSSFVLQLSTEGDQQDEIILAMIEPGPTLRDTWQGVDEAIRSRPETDRVDISSNEALHIPMLFLNLQKWFQELIGQEVLNLEGIPDNRIAVAREVLQFALDESGADLIAMAEMAVIGEFGEASEATTDAKRPRRFVFDQPFLLALREPGQSEPYFLMWVADPTRLAK